MAEVTKIQWCDHTFNPWRGCTKVSAGCANCYADTLSVRNPKVLGVWGPCGTRVVAAESYWREPVKWNKAAAADGVRRRVFCASLADVFEGPETMPADAWDAVDAARTRLFQTIMATPNLDWLLLTKRPENICMWWPGSVPDYYPSGWENVWLGTSVENQATADERIPHLLRMPAAIRFLSIEPLLGPVDLRPKAPESYSMLGKFYSTGTFDPTGMSPAPDRVLNCFPRINWVIVGGESGPGSRECRVEWIRDIVRQCRHADVPVFVKQLGSRATGDYYEDRDEYESVRGVDWPAPIGWNYRDGQPPIGSRVFLPLSDIKGGDPAEWPEDLRIREFPHT